MKTGIRYIVVKGSDDGSLLAGDRISLGEDGSLGNLDAVGFLPKDEVAEAMAGAVLEVDRAWVDHRKRKAAETLAALEGL